MSQNPEAMGEQPDNRLYATTPALAPAHVQGHFVGNPLPLSVTRPQLRSNMTSQLSALEAPKHHEEVEALQLKLCDLETINQLAAIEVSKLQEELEALHNKLQDLEKEMPKEKHNKLCAEKNAQIKEPAVQVEKVNKENNVPNKTITEEDTLRKLNAKIDKQVSIMEFTYKQGKKGKKK